LKGIHGPSSRSQPSVFLNSVGDKLSYFWESPNKMRRVRIADRHGDVCNAHVGVREKIDRSVASALVGYLFEADL
jgi:hypothetical protein